MNPIIIIIIIIMFVWISWNYAVKDYRQLTMLSFFVGYKKNRFGSDGK
jgi:uncharacterized membrane protein (DUF106 family)